MSIKRKVNVFFKKRFDKWLSKRIPSARSHQLTSRNIFILPTAFGICYLGFVLLLFMLGTNYQNNIILLLSYLLASFFITVMMHSFFNFSSLTLTVRKAEQQQSGYAGQLIQFPINVIVNKRHYDINFSLKELTGDADVIANKMTLSQCDQGNNHSTLVFQANKRGLYSLGRLTVFSEYSFGLFKSWSELAFGQQALVYPAPIAVASKQFAFTTSPARQADNYQASGDRGIDEFSELKSFIPGESKARTAWKHLAKGQGHYTKHYQENSVSEHYLSINDMPGADIETKLGQLSFLVNELTKAEQTFGLKLPAKAIDIEPNSGFAHQHNCLQALALY